MKNPAKSSVKLLFMVVLLSCSTHDRSNPIDPNGSNWNPPTIAVMEDTTVAVNDSFFIHAFGTDKNGTVEKYLWALDGKSFLDTTTDSKIKVAFKEAGNRMVKIKVINDIGVPSSPEAIVKIAVHSYQPYCQPIHDTAIGIDDSLFIRVIAEDTNGTIIKYIWVLDSTHFDTTIINQKTMTFSNIGQHLICIHVLDDDGIVSIQRSFKVQAKPPNIAVFNFPTEWNYSLTPSDNNYIATYNRVMSIAFDMNGNKWVGTSFGVQKFDGSNWTAYGPDYNWTTVIAIDNSDIKWINNRYCVIPYTDYNMGLSKFDGTAWTVFDSLAGLPNNNVTSIAIDSNNDKWVGTWGGGVAKFDGITWTIYKTSNSGLPNNNIYAIAIDKNGNKWIGSEGGLAKFDGIKWDVYKIPGFSGKEKIMFTAIDGNGIKWVIIYHTDYTGSTLGDEVCDGLAKFDDTEWIVYRFSDYGFYGGDITSLAIDRIGNKWIGTAGDGLAKFDGTNLTIYNVANTGLPTDIIRAISIDKDNVKWIGTYKGLTAF